MNGVSGLNRLELQVMKAINGEGSVVNIIGEAGIGKSRLMAELRRREVIQKVNLLEGRAISIGRNLSFHPLILARTYFEVGKSLMEPQSTTGNSTASAPKNIWTRPRSCFGRWTCNGTWSNWSG
jgi:predicted ATPase